MSQRVDTQGSIENTPFLLKSTVHHHRSAWSFAGM